MSFRINAQSIFFTYPKCDLSPITLLDFIKGTRPVMDYVVCREQHADGTNHLHAFIKFEKKINSSNPRLFDIEGYHPNWQGARSPAAVCEYVKKGGEFISSPGLESALLRQTWGELIVASENSVEFMKGVQVSYPRDFALKYNDLKSFAEQFFSTQEALSEPILPPGPMLVPRSMETWQEDYLLTPHARPARPRTLVLVGPTRSGKSVWARSLGKHMYMQGMFFLEKWDQSADYLILDDIEWDYLPSKKQLLGGQWDIILSDKYKRKRQVPNGKPVIYIINPDEYRKMQNSTMHEWLLENCIFVELTNKLF